MSPSTNRVKNIGAVRQASVATDGRLIAIGFKSNGIWSAFVIRRLANRSERMVQVGENV